MIAYQFIVQLQKLRQLHRVGDIGQSATQRYSRSVNYMQLLGMGFLQVHLHKLTPNFVDDFSSMTHCYI
jgi:hypothetical protein